MKFLTLIFVVVFGVLSLAPNMQGAQLFKLSEVVEHYQAHQHSEEMFSSFLDFIVDHYFKNRETNKNEQELPFKSVVAAPVLITFQKVELQPVTLLFRLRSVSKPIHYYQSKISQVRLNSIWNPPQIS